MNKTKIEWADYTWNPITGCSHGCNYCYARKIAIRFEGHFEPRFHQSRLLQPAKLKNPSIIFVGSMGDLFGDWVWVFDINEVLDICKSCEQHTFIFLTKNPKRFKEFNFPENCWIGFSASTQEDFCQRFKESLGGMGPRNRFVSLEPMQEKIIFGNNIHWVIAGQETGNRKSRIIVKQEWIDRTVNFCRRENIPLFIKDNVGYKEKIQEFPIEFNKGAINDR